MDYGLFLDSQGLIDDAPDSVLEDLLALTRTARETGFDLISMGQHYLTDQHQLQLIPTLARLSAEAPSLTVATGVVLLPLHHPVSIAEHLTTLDIIADSAIAGVGIGYRDTEFDNFGIPKPDRVGRLREGVAIMNRLWTETNVSYDGRFYSLANATINPRPETKPPVWIAANAQPAIERAARIGDAWYVNPHATRSELTRQKETYDAIREERGASTAVPLIRETFVARSRATAMETARPYLESKYQRYTDAGQDDAMEDASAFHQAFEDLADDRFLLGTPADVCAMLDRYVDPLDLSHVLFRTHWPGMPIEHARASIELIADEVIPNI